MLILKRTFFQMTYIGSVCMRRCCYEGIMLSIVKSIHRYGYGYRFCHLQETDNLRAELEQQH